MSTSTKDIHQLRQELQSTRRSKLNSESLEIQEPQRQPKDGLLSQLIRLLFHEPPAKKN